MMACLALAVSPTGAAVWQVRPSAFVTWGDYSDSRTSRECAAYLSAAHSGWLVSTGYGDLKIDHEEWTYHQTQWTAGVLYARSSWSARAYYSQVRGDFDATAYVYHSMDDGSLWNGEATCSLGQCGFGYAFTRFHGKGYWDRTTAQHTARIEWTPHPSLFLSVRPNYVRINDGRRLESMVIRVHDQPVHFLVLKFGGMIGKRAYTFDNDLFTLYNQEETQRGLVFTQADLLLSRRISAMVEYILTSFDGYEITYMVMGLRAVLG
jgi:hypothetical protein